MSPLVSLYYPLPGVRGGPDLFWRDLEGEGSKWLHLPPLGLLSFQETRERALIVC